MNLQVQSPFQASLSSPSPFIVQRINQGELQHYHSSQVGFPMSSNLLGQQNEPWDIKSLQNMGVKIHDQEGNYGNPSTKKGLTTLSKGKKEEGGGLSVKRNPTIRRCSKGHWRPTEDAKLKELVSQCGPKNWNMMAEHLQGRSGKSCRLRWFNQLDPKISKAAFSEEEEERLLTAHRMYGKKWALIAKLFPGRTDNSVKNHWHVTISRRLREQASASLKNNASSLDSVLTRFDGSESATNDAPTESTFMCTDLSLSTSSKFSPSREHHGSQTGSFLSDLPCQRQMRRAMGVNECNHEDLNKRVPAIDSVSNNRNLQMTGENEKIKMPIVFFDFLGVGAS